jgi:polygalacturonase
MKTTVQVFHAVLFLQVAVVQTLAGTYDVRDYGATGNGKTLDSPAINKAIEACAATGGGGGGLPAGTYLSGSIRLRSNIDLHLETGATLLAAPADMNAFDKDELPYKAWQDFGHSHWKNSLIWGIELENISITGRGTIDGHNMTAGESRDGEGDKAIGLRLCRGILIRDLTILNAGHFAVLPTGCDNMVIENLLIDTNRDGINLDCCRNVRVADCTINSPGDDALCFKSSYALGYKRATEMVTVTNCLMSGFSKEPNKNRPGPVVEGSFGENSGNGRIKFGTESNGGFKKIVISNCILDHCYGISFQINDGGIMEDITVSNIVMRSVVGGPICIEISKRSRGPNSPPPGKVRRINISNVISDISMFGCFINGLNGDPVEDITLNNIRIRVHGKGNESDVKNTPPDDPDKPWQGVLWGAPSYGFYCRHVKGLVMNGIIVEFENDDVRPAFVFDDVENLDLFAIGAYRSKQNERPIVFKNVRNSRVHDCQAFPPVDASFEVVPPSESIRVDKPFSLTVRGRASQSGLALAELFLGQRRMGTQYVWLEADEAGEIVFPGLRIDSPGEYAVRLGHDNEKTELVVAP